MYPNNMGKRGVPGASLRVWRDWFPNALIFGADIDRQVLFNEERIRTHYVDQTDPAAIGEMWQAIGHVDFDLMLDDGLHAFHAGLTLFEASFAKLRRGGVYIIEDVNLKDLERYHRHFDGTGHWAEVHVLERRRNRPFDNNLVIIRKQ